MERYLTKSRFKLAVECPRKLFYTDKDQYPDQKDEDYFIKELMESGLQVGELAKIRFPNGHDIKALDYSEAEDQTNELLKKNIVTIFEAVIKFDNFFLRADILDKKEDVIELIEVKSKSYSYKRDKSKFCKAGWKEYIEDVAFQKYVLKKAFPEYKIKSFLMLVDKDKVCSVDGLFGKFKIIKDKNNKKTVVKPTNLSDEDKEVDILTKVCVDPCVDNVIDGKGLVDRSISFKDEVQIFSEKYKRDEKIKVRLGNKCNKCEFRCTEEQRKQGFIDGFQECWKEMANFKKEDFKDQTVLDLHNCKDKDIDVFIQKKKFKIKSLSLSDINTSTSTGKRQAMQIQQESDGNKASWIDLEGLRDEMKTWKFPLHFIDFETSRPAIPFTKGKRPYEEIAFQFSHHIVDECGKIEHKDQYLNTKASFFPNFDFVRALKKALEEDCGTIFRYWDHENTCLTKIKKQLEHSHENDKADLIRFICSIIKNGQRAMVDLGKGIIKEYYYSPLTKGSNSIKKVLPAILNESKFLQDKYSNPIYGSDEIKSLNFKEKIWIQKNGNSIVDPYKLLNSNVSFLDYIDSENSQFQDITEGGEAMMAYHYLQFSDISEEERNNIEDSLLRYCELDTFAMVMIYECIRDICSQ